MKANDDDVDIFFLLGVLNSSSIDWYFKHTSSNNHINNYEINNFPIPVNCSNKHEISDAVRKYLDNRDVNLLAQIDMMVYKAFNIASNQPDDERIADKSDEQNSCSALNPVEQLYRDLSQIIPMITLDECSAIISGQASVKDICLIKKTDADHFE